MLNIIDWILNLFRDEEAARAFVMAPQDTLRDAGLAGVSAAQMTQVAATAVPSMVLGGGDPIVGLQRAVSNHYGFAPATDYSPAASIASPVYAPERTFAPQTDTELASHNQTDLASHNATPIMSPNQDSGANSQQGAFNLGFGDITFGDKSTTTATDGAVVVDGNNDGDIVSGDGAVLGNNNDVNNGDVLAGTGSNVNVGSGDVDDNGTTATGGSSVIKDNDGPVFHDVDASGGNGGGASGGDSLIGLGSGDSSGGDAGGGGIVIVSNDTATNTVGGDQSQVGGDSAASSSTSTESHSQSYSQSHTTTTVSDSSDHSVDDSYSSSVANSTSHSTDLSASLFDNGHDTSLTDTSLTGSALDNSHDTALASGNHHLLGF
ncbi:IniB N-terminal domain-containing protein [Mycolicibacterium palauense]|uniref:IniB N-terminal domain-containing protein n=1 Tax=Mycolicibacterium palauense TaxID=2034511 RepID=UPI000BFED0B1|nr:IniB N-terminal domain-containing protein [Mycolicibacterium palauense]